MVRQVRGAPFSWMGLRTRGCGGAENRGETGMRGHGDAGTRGLGGKELATAPYSGHTERMSTLTIEFPARRDQIEFNLKRWSELLADTVLGRQLAKIEGRIETDRHGRVILHRPADFQHGTYQAEIGFRLTNVLLNGRVTVECPISTADGVRAADVAWISKRVLK